MKLELSKLQSAAMSHESAWAAFQDALKVCRETGVPVPKAIMDNHRKAKHRLDQAQADELTQAMQDSIYNR